MSRIDIAQGLYVITTAEGYPCKVGTTANLSARVGQLQTGNWVRLEAAWFSFVLGRGWSNRKANLWAAFNTAAVQLEVDVHRKMRELDLSLGGEWFDVGVEDCIAVIDKVAKEQGYKLSGIEVLQGISGYTTLHSRQLSYLKAMIATEESARDAILGRSHLTGPDGCGTLA